MLLPELLLQEHLGRLRLQLRERPPVHQGRGHLRREEHVGDGVAGDGVGAVLPRRLRDRRVRVLQVQA